MGACSFDWIRKRLGSGVECFSFAGPWISYLSSGLKAMLRFGLSAQVALSISKFMCV